ncbi:MAG: HlyD family efflux transporter periplasmic adaptor subunit, partial [Acidobacteria bacterium]|nr:HlyD family efflux transporter periplasmic adaptor subunit [Acidobacteriota bacterium]
QAREGLRSLEVRAPTAGILTWDRGWRGDVLEVGAQIYPGQQIAEIAGLDELEAEVFVLEADAGGLAVGQPAEIELEAVPGTVLEGTIRRVDSVAKPRFRGSPVQYFGVTVSFGSDLPDSLKPGQRLRARLFLNRLPEALVIPRQAVFSGPQGAQVYVLQDEEFEPRAIRVAASSLGLVAVEEGLEAGETVALDEPPRRASESARSIRQGNGPETAGASEAEGG